MIPKVIHYCWFGRGEKNTKAKKCIDSWKRICPDYRIIEWNEDNFDTDANEYTRKCYREKKFAFLSDYARLVILEREGGLYFDTDVEMLRRPDRLLEYPAFFGFENNENVNTGHGFGTVAHGDAVRSLLAQYDALLDGTSGYVICPQLNTAGLLPFGLVLDGSRQDLGCCAVFPVDVFNPYDDLTGRLRKTRDTVSVHWYAKSWMDSRTVFKSRLTKPFHRLFGVDCFKKKSKGK